MLIYCKTLWFMKDKIQVFIPQICVPAILSEWRNLFWIKSLNVQVFKYLLKVILVATHLLMLLMKIKTGIRYNVGNQAKERISKWVFLENKARQFSEKRIFLTHWYAHARVRGFMYVCKEDGRGGVGGGGRRGIRNICARIMWMTSAAIEMASFRA